MATLLLRLAAPMQSWGMDSKFEIRKTNREPTKSGVIGMIAAAFGFSRDDDDEISKFNSLKFGVRVDQEGKLLSDYQIVKKEEKSKSINYVTWRYYLADAIFLVGLESENTGLLYEISEALKTPVFPLFLGRRSCPATLPICLGIREENLEQALENEQSLVPKWKKKGSPKVRMVIDAAAQEPGSAYRQDAPISFSPLHRQFGYRMVKEDVIINKTIPETQHDPFQEL